LSIAVPAYECGDWVKMRNDPIEQVGIVVGYKVVNNGDPDYLVIWNPGLSQWHANYEIETATKLQDVPFLDD
jgi:hypothetical protein